MYDQKWLDTFRPPPPHHPPPPRKRLCRKRKVAPKVITDARTNHSREACEVMRGARRNRIGAPGSADQVVAKRQT